MLGMAHEAKWLISARGDSGTQRLSRVVREVREVREVYGVSWGWIRAG